MSSIALHIQTPMPNMLPRGACLPRLTQEGQQRAAKEINLEAQETKPYLETVQSD